MSSVSNQVIKSKCLRAIINAGIINPVKDFATVIAELVLMTTVHGLYCSKGSDTVEVLPDRDCRISTSRKGFTVCVNAGARIDGVAPVGLSRHGEMQLATH
ncbi:hypothetical protein KCP76_19570 [Salmonella enterica subsp. enterica serovar Weltevreden]|nr:hypothetical protein KCP76_19570 [Salmonella enterica subsp. enterica serovar Weltevreden]